MLRVVFSRDGKTIQTATADQTMHTWQVRDPAEGPADRLALWAQGVTAKALEPEGGVHGLDAATWQRRQRDLEGADAPPQSVTRDTPSRTPAACPR